MKILILGPYPTGTKTDSVRGGVEAVVVNMVKGLSRFRDLDIHIVTTSYGIDKEMDFKSDGITIHAVPSDRHFGNITLYLRVRRKISEKINQIKPDLIHTHTLGYYTLAALDSGHKKVIMSTHGIADRNWRMSGSIIDKIRKNLWYCRYKKCMNTVKDVIVNSSYAKNCLTGLKGRNIYELNNPISEAFFETDETLEEELRLLFVGNISEEKGMMTLLCALKRVKESFDGIKLMVAGQAKEHSFYSKSVRFVEENGLDGSVHFLGHLDEDELKEEYAKASIFVFPSKRDVAPLALLQAMAAGKAIVATTVGGIPYIIDDGVNGFLVEKDDFVSLADKIVLFIKDPLLRKRFGLYARQKVFKDYKIEAVTDRLYEIYSGMVR